MTPATPEDLFARLDALGIAHVTHRHRPVFTVEEGRDLKAQMPGGHTKNLFLKDKKGALFLLCAISDTAIDLNAVSKLLGAGRFSFGSAERLMRHLGIEPGSVTLFALINDPERHVTLVLDEALFAHDPVNFHPLRNDATTAIGPDDMLRFIRSLGREPIRLAFDAAGQPSRIEPETGSAHVGGASN
ncbi:MAG: prolyl-tRNA synthetase associated domain-containing protein [Hyphomonadaceae bacterium]|nr:prolyl-tRNA synthetase associated domain-containing protein [Hyphomonadaceae bacterium]